MSGNAFGVILQRVAGEGLAAMAKWRRKSLQVKWLWGKIHTKKTPLFRAGQRRESLIAAMVVFLDFYIFR